MLLKHLRILLSFSGLHKLFSSLIYELCLYIFLSCSSLRLCFVSMRLSLGAPDNTLILPSSSSKSLSLCSNLIPLLLDCFSKNLLWNKMWGCKNIRLPARSHLPVDIWSIQHFLEAVSKCQIVCCLYWCIFWFHPFGKLFHFRAYFCGCSCYPRWHWPQWCQNLLLLQRKTHRQQRQHKANSFNDCKSMPGKNYFVCQVAGISY